jgi:hypothetical protein
MASQRRTTAKETTYVAARSQPKSSESASVVTPVNSDDEALRAEVAALRAEVAQLRGAVRIASGREVEPVQHVQSTTVNMDWQNDPRHDLEFLAADNAWALGRGTKEDRDRAYTAAKLRIAATQGANMPGRPEDFAIADSHAQRRSNAARGPDFTQVPIAAGGVMSKSPSGQITIKYPQQLTCELGHPAAEGDRYCTTCGQVSSPELGTLWDEEQRLKAQRLREEGIPED